MFRVARKIRVGRETGNTHIFFCGLTGPGLFKFASNSTFIAGKFGIYKCVCLAHVYNSGLLFCILKLFFIINASLSESSFCEFCSLHVHSYLYIYKNLFYGCEMQIDMSCDMTKPTKWVCAQRRLSRPVWSDSLLSTQWVAKDPSFLHADREDSESSLGAYSLCWFCHFVAHIVMQNSDPKGQNFLYTSQTCGRFFFWHTFWFPKLDFSIHYDTQICSRPT